MGGGQRALCRSVGRGDWAWRSAWVAGGALPAALVHQSDRGAAKPLQRGVAQPRRAPRARERELVREIADLRAQVAALERNSPRPTARHETHRLFHALTAERERYRPVRAELLPFLAQDYAIDAIIADERPRPIRCGELPYSARGRSARRSRTTRTIYQVGNSPEHAYILDHAEREPGICVLHDVMLQHLQVVARVAGGASAAAEYRAEMERRYGGRAQLRPMTCCTTARRVPYAKYPSASVWWSEPGDHRPSRYARDRCYGIAGCEGLVVPHGVPLLPRATGRGACRPGAAQDALIVAAVGNLIPEKRLGWP